MISASHASNSSLEHDPISLGRRSFESEEDVEVVSVGVVVRAPSTVSSSVAEEVDDDWIALIFETRIDDDDAFRPALLVFAAVFKAGKAAADVDANAEDAIFALDLIIAEHERALERFVCVLWGKKKREKRDLIAFWMSLLVKKRGDKEKQIFSEKQNSLFGGQIYIYMVKMV